MVGVNQLEKLVSHAFAYGAFVVSGVEFCSFVDEFLTCRFYEVRTVPN